MFYQGTTVSQVFNCLDCDEFWEDYRNARKKAMQHSKKTGHKVSGNITREYMYHYKTKTRG